MQYELWDKVSPENNMEAIDLIGQEQMENDDQFIIFHDESGGFIALESVDTMKSVYGFTGETWDAVAQEYVSYRTVQVEVEPTTEEYLIDLDFRMSMIELGL